MAGIGSGASLFLAGCVASCGVLLVVAGASKLYRAARRMPDASAIRRALRMTRRRWQRTEPGIGVLECAIGVIVFAGVYPALGGAAMAVLGAGFCALLGYARAQRVPGGCGCIEWRAVPPPSAETVAGREMARAALVAVAGLAGAVFLRAEAGAFGQPWFYGGILAGSAVLILLSMRALPRTPVCRRPVWFPARATLRALAGHGVFEAMAESAGPLGPVVRYRRAGCSQEFWFTPLPPPAAGPGLAGGAERAVVFQVRHMAPGEDLAVQASVRDGRAAGDWPARVIAARGPGSRVPEGGVTGSRVPEGGIMRSLAVSLAALACALALAACGSTPAPGSAPAAGSSPSPAGTPSATADSPAAGVAACATTQLKVGLTNTGALGGQAGGYLRFTNDGATACRMHGWPVVVAVTAAGQATTLRHAQSTMYGAWQAPASLPVLNLKPGQSAYAVVAASDHPAGSAGNCPAPYVRLRVSPPGRSGRVVVSAWLPGTGAYLPACPAIDGSPTGEVSAITPLSGLPH